MALLDGEYFHSLHSLVFWIEASLARTPFHGVAPRRDHATRHLSRCCECMEFGRKNVRLRRCVARAFRLRFKLSGSGICGTARTRTRHSAGAEAPCGGGRPDTSKFGIREVRGSAKHVTIVKKDEFVVLSRIVGKTTILTACAHPDERRAGSAATRTLFCPGAQRVVPTALAGHIRQSDHESNSS